MATVIDHHTTGPAEDTGLGTILGVILAVLFVVLFFVYGLPALRGAANDDGGRQDINVNLNDTRDSGGSVGGSDMSGTAN